MTLFLDIEPEPTPCNPILNLDLKLRHARSSDGLDVTLVKSRRHNAQQLYIRPKGNRGNCTMPLRT